MQWINPLVVLIDELIVSMLESKEYLWSFFFILYRNDRLSYFILREYISAVLFGVYRADFYTGMCLLSEVAVFYRRCLLGSWLWLAVFMIL